MILEKKVGVVIVAFNNNTMLCELIEELMHQTLPPNEIVIVDNGNDEETPVCTQQNFLNINYIRMGRNTGSAGGFYEGIKAAVKLNNYVLTLDDDTGLRSDTIEKLVDGFQDLDSKYHVGAVRTVGFSNADGDPFPLKIAP